MKREMFRIIQVVLNIIYIYSIQYNTIQHINLINLIQQNSQLYTYI